MFTLQDLKKNIVFTLILLTFIASTSTPCSAKDEIAPVNSEITPEFVNTLSSATHTPEEKTLSTQKHHHTTKTALPASNLNLLNNLTTASSEKTNQKFFDHNSTDDHDFSEEVVYEEMVGQEVKEPLLLPSRSHTDQRLNVICLEQDTDEKLLHQSTVLPNALTIGNMRADGHGPIGMMGEHTHKKGEWMLSYRYMHMFMKENQDGSSNLSTGDVLKRFMVSPISMKTDMHMLGAMAAPTNWLTLSTMVPYVFRSMDHETRMGKTFRTRSEGFGDIQLNGLVPAIKTENHQVTLKAGVSFPTGSINQRDATPMGRNQRLPYPMQIGSGTYDLLPGITYRGQSRHWSWGLQSGGTVRLGKNENDYRLGNQVFITPWISRKWSRWLSSSVRVNGQAWGNITGADPELNPRVIATARPDLRSGRRLDMLFGINLLSPVQGVLKNQRLAIEMGFPLHQHLSGPQLKTKFILTAGWQLSL